MVTGSHNPPDYNGFKMVLAGEAIYGDAIQGLYQAIERDDFQPAATPGGYATHDIKDAYIERIVGDVKIARPIKIAVDCGNGVAGAFAGELFRAHGLRSDRTVLRSRRPLPEPPPGPGPPGKPAGPDRAPARRPTPKSAWPSTATATASAWSPRMARSSSRTAR